VRAFPFVLVLEDGEPADPAMFVTAAPDWHEGDVFLPRGGERFRILAIEPMSDDELPFYATWTVEPVLAS
jgi:hypothetical protein